MGTRGAIARLTDKGFEGRYHHWDSYPSGLGETLFQLYNGHFKKDLKVMLKTLIDDHPAGWSTICKDWAQQPGFLEYDNRKKLPENDPKLNRPECYCHGDRKEKAWLVTQDNASDSGCEWVYAFDVNNGIMHIMSSFNEDNTKMIGAFGCGNPKAKWLTVKEVDLNKKAPYWKALEEKVRNESHKLFKTIQQHKKEEFLKTMSNGFAKIESLGLIAIPLAHYALWYKEDVSSHLFLDTKIAIAKRISKLTLKSPMWLDKDTNYIEQFPELKPYSSTKMISGLQLCAVMQGVVEEMQQK